MAEVRERAEGREGARGREGASGGEGARGHASAGFRRSARSACRALLLGILGLGLAALVPGVHAMQVPPQQTTAFVNANVVPMDREAVLSNHTVVVSKGRIAAVGPSASTDVPDGATVIDATGKYLMPGLAEMHGHMPGGEMEEIVMFLYVANGVTTVRGMLGQDGHLALREKANAGEIIAPTLYMAGPSFNDGTVDSPGEAESRVRQQKSAGWDLLKVHPGLTVEEVRRHGGHRAGGRHSVRGARAGGRGSGTRNQDGARRRSTISTATSSIWTRSTSPSRPPV